MGKRAGRWGLVKRLTIRDFDEIRAVSEMQRHDRGRRDRTDASYEVLGCYPEAEDTMPYGCEVGS